MPKPANTPPAVNPGKGPKEQKATVVLADGNLHFNQAGSYTIEYLPSGQVKIKVDGGHAQVLSASEWDSISSFSFADGAVLNSPVHIDGVTFSGADAGGAFEISHNLDALIGHLINTHGLPWTVENLVINSSQTDTFKVLWDFLDDGYVAGGNYYDIALNETFVRLGVEYVDYLAEGGDPLTFVTAKFTADGADADTLPEREQSMHDNLLGNLTIGAINDRFASDPTLKAELLGLIPDEYETRAYYDGADQRVGGTVHDAVRAFDYDRGWDRPDYFDAAFDALIDPVARDGGQMYYGSGNTITDWNVLRHEGAQIELGLKIKHRQGGDYDEAFIDSNGIAHYVVTTGPQPGNPARAEWNFDFAASDYSPDTDFTYKVEIDVDPGEGVEWLTVYSSDVPFDTDTGPSGDTFQNSSNYAFYAAFIDTDPDTPGVQPYAFGEGEFNIRFSAFEAVSGDLVASHEVIVHVENMVI